MKWEEGSRIVREGSLVPSFTALDVNNVEIELGYPFQKPVWLIFYRYAKCPLCNHHFYMMNQIYPYLEAAGVRVIAVFCSSPEYFPEKLGLVENPKVEIVPDPSREIYRRFGVEDRYLSVFAVQNLTGFIRATSAGHTQPSYIDNGLFQTPAHFLIDHDGIVQKAHYGTHFDDHLAWEVIRNFAETEFPEPTATNLAPPPVPASKLSTGKVFVQMPTKSIEIDYTGGLRHRDEDTKAGIQKLNEIADDETKPIEAGHSKISKNLPAGDSGDGERESGFVSITSADSSSAAEIAPKESEPQKLNEAVNSKEFQQAAFEIFKVLDMGISEDIRAVYERHLERVFPIEAQYPELVKKVKNYPEKVREAYKKNQKINVSQISLLLDVSAFMLKRYSKNYHGFETPFVMAAIDYFVNDLDAHPDFEDEDGLEDDVQVMMATVAYFDLGHSLKSAGIDIDA